jgi:hypothetical protein
VLPPSWQACDRALVKVARRSACSTRSAGRRRWKRRFLEGWRAGKPERARAGGRPRAHAEEIAALDAIMAELDRGHPIGDWLYKSAWSYRVAARMLEQIGAARVHALLGAAVRAPDQRYRSQEASNTDAAQDMLRITDELLGKRAAAPMPCDIPRGIRRAPARDAWRLLHPRTGCGGARPGAGLEGDGRQHARCASGHRAVLRGRTWS